MPTQIFCARTQVILHAGVSIATAETALELAATAADLHMRARTHTQTRTHTHTHTDVFHRVPVDVADAATAVVADVFAVAATVVAANVFAAAATAKTARMLPRMLCTHTRSLAEC